eukprot:236283-Pleurochrysis_carterae.AAC.1
MRAVRASVTVRRDRQRTVARSQRDRDNMRDACELDPSYGPSIRALLKRVAEFVLGEQGNAGCSFLTNLQIAGVKSEWERCAANASA